MSNPARARMRMSVTAYLVLGFAACTAALVGLIVNDAAGGLDRERQHTRDALLSLTQEAVTDESMTDQMETLAAGYGEDPRVLSLQEQDCLDAFGSLGGALANSHLHVVRLDGSTVCSVYSRALTTTPPPFVAGPWLADVLATGHAIALDPAIDPVLHEPAQLLGVPLTGADGNPVAVMAFVQGTAWDIPIPPTAPEGAVVIALSPDRQMVLATSAGAPVAVGDSVAGTPLADTIASGRSVTDVDGTSRMYEEALSGGDGYHILAGVPTHVALGPVQAQVRRTVVVGGIALVVLAALGILLHRRLTRPISRLGKAIAASLDGDADVRAPVTGPRELITVATAYNDLVDERRGRELELFRRARTDALTGLPNRTALDEHLQVKLLVAGPAVEVAVLFLDLDRFKQVNDAYGHATGDEVLVALGERLTAALPKAFVARFGGDEYVLVLDDIKSAEGAAVIADRVRNVLSTPFVLGHTELYLSGSIGIAVAQVGDTPEDVIRNADIAMYRSKETESGSYAVFDEHMREWVMQRATIEGDLHRALERGEFWLGYQPKLEVVSGAIVGYEALLRWNHPVHGLVPPGDFIPVAEESGLIVDIGGWVLETACRQAAEWRAMRGGIGIPVAVNLAAQQLANPHLPDVVLQRIREAGAQPRDIVLEVTESAVLADTQGVSARLRMLRDAGVRVSVDDFGTGYSSLSYLQQLPIDELKIDRSFVSALPSDGSSEAIIGSVIGLAHAIGLSVVGEGVETREQLEDLQSLGCDLAQGFYLGRPVPSHEAAERMRGELIASTS